MNHPLTNDIIEEISVSYLKNCEGVKSNMRSAADWQLEQVLRFMEENGFGIRKILLLKDAMRPLYPVREHPIREDD